MLFREGASAGSIEKYVSGNQFRKRKVEKSMRGKKWIAAILTATMVLSMAACGSEKAPAAEGQPVKKVAPQATATAAQRPQSATQAQVKRPTTGNDIKK